MINAYEGLVQYKNNTDTVEIAPRLAESWEDNPTHDVYTFHLRKGVTFHDGTPFTSAAVDVAFKRRIAVKGGAAYMVDVVKSVDDARRLHRGHHAEAAEHGVPELPGVAVRSEDGIARRAEGQRRLRRRPDLSVLTRSGHRPVHADHRADRGQVRADPVRRVLGTQVAVQEGRTAGLHRRIRARAGVRQRHRRHDRRRPAVLEPGQVREGGQRIELLPADPAGRVGDGELRATSSSRTPRPGSRS